MSEEMIEPCPFAHAVKRGPYVHTHDEDYDGQQVVCGDCAASGPFMDHSDFNSEAETSAAAIAGWNTRSAYNPNERLTRAESLLKQALEAIESARSEPLFIMRDAIRNYLEDHSALSPLPQGED